ncbi:MAG: sulfotransferase [Planctomycetota bacterium]
MFAPAFEAVPDGLPWLVSFPRTGSHRLRVMLELFFDRPMLTRHFFEHDNDDWLLIHDHDDRLRLVPNGPVIYLWRDPVPTVFSQLTYMHGPDIDRWTEPHVRAVADAYRANLARWLGRDAPQTPAVVLTYEAMSRDMADALAPAIAFLGGEHDAARIESIEERVTEDLIASKSRYNDRVMDTRADKATRRAAFNERFGAMIDALDWSMIQARKN